jgi:hypothetical protein
MRSRCWTRQELLAYIVQAVEQNKGRPWTPKCPGQKRCEISLAATVQEDGRIRVGYSEIPWAHIESVFSNCQLLTMDIRVQGRQVWMVLVDEGAYRRLACRRMAVLLVGARWTRLDKNVRKMVGRAVWATRKHPGWYTARLEDEVLGEGVTRLK